MRPIANKETHNVRYKREPKSSFDDHKTFESLEKEIAQEIRNNDSHPQNCKK